jgi:type IV pilus biogenesis protein CpaD/CtpE
MIIPMTKNLLLLLLSALLVACASGSAIVTGATRAPLDPAVVKLYIKPPEKYDVIGIVKASSDAGITEQASQDYAVDELKKQAAKLGANGVLLETTGQSTYTHVGSHTYGYGAGQIYSFPVTFQTVSGKAIYVHQ